MNTDWWDRHNEGQYPFGTFHSAPTGGMYSWQRPRFRQQFPEIADRRKYLLIQISPLMIVRRLLHLHDFAVLCEKPCWGTRPAQAMLTQAVPVF
jgi:hypothetical protein